MLNSFDKVLYYGWDLLRKPKVYNTCTSQVRHAIRCCESECQTFGPAVVVDDGDTSVQTGEEGAVSDGEPDSLHGSLSLHHTVVEQSELAVQTCHPPQSNQSINLL